EYEHYSPAEALRDVKANGFGDFACTSANDYIVQYILTYRRGLRRLEPADKAPAHKPEAPARGAAPLAGASGLCGLVRQLVENAQAHGSQPVGLTGADR